MNSKITAFIGDKNTFEIVDNEKPGYIYYNKYINKFRGFLKDEANGDEKFLWRTVEVMEDNACQFTRDCYFKYR
jgi:hypothetical protein